ncbi:MAG: small acid-soluble spore protein SspI [Bacilli bacterium]|nr:small acid-soluble spore protein SspI [Bacilli bacterium]
MNIKEHIINNFKNDDHKTLIEAIEESVESNDEVTLPGLGVFLSLIWEGADKELKNNLIDILKQQINSN